MKRLKLSTDEIIALYNPQKQELIGVFASHSLAARYCFELYTFKDVNKIYDAARRKNKIYKTKFSFPIAVRFANDIQKKLLEGDSYVILNGYEQPMLVQMKGYTSTKEDLLVSATERSKRRWIEQARQKQLK